ncbi:hypothetical protein AAE478_006001 [Parahypoxylon ruwenzoriense]
MAVPLYMQGDTFIDLAAPQTQPVHLPIGCLCGRIYGSIDGHISTHRICHCPDCKKMTGGTYGEYLIVREESVSFITGRPRMYSFTGCKELIQTHLYVCDHCHTPIYKREGDLRPAAFEVFVGALQDSEWLNRHRPDMEIWTRKKCEWLPKLERTPPPE